MLTFAEMALIPAALKCWDSGQPCDLLYTPQAWHAIMMAEPSLHRIIVDDRSVRHMRGTFADFLASKGFDSRGFFSIVDNGDGTHCIIQFHTERSIGEECGTL